MSWITVRNSSIAKPWLSMIKRRPRRAEETIHRALDSTLRSRKRRRPRLFHKKKTPRIQWRVTHNEGVFDTDTLDDQE